MKDMDGEQAHTVVTTT